jgi:hypothetical protein
MRFLDQAKLDALDAGAFRTKKPYPWINPSGLVTSDGLSELRNALPDISLFKKTIGMARAHGQMSHDRHELFHDGGPGIPAAWKSFIKELGSKAYRGFLARMIGRADFSTYYQWQYSTAGCSVSPHCDSEEKFASHIFYINPAEEWDPSWGGETLILDDAGRLDRHSAPGFDDFAGFEASISTSPHSLLFMRGDHSWHGVKALKCPEGVTRRIFTVVIDRIPTLKHRFIEKYRRFSGHPRAYVRH